MFDKERTRKLDGEYRMEATQAKNGIECERRKPNARLLLPPRDMASCIYGAFVRDTRKCQLPPKDRLNHFAASPLCALSWCFEGDCALVESDEQGGLIETLLEPIVFSGPQTRAATSINKGPVHAITVAFYPDAFRKLTGLDVARYVDRTVPVNDVLSVDFLEKATDIFQIENAADAFNALIEYLRPKWQISRSENTVAVNSVSDWALSVIASAPKAGIGRSLRQVERRIKDWTGQSRRDLEFFTRNERSFELAVTALRNGKVNAAEVALQSGFSDQSHLGRNVKRQTGHSPKDLLWHIENEEAYWSYRLIAGMEKGR